MKSSFIFLIIGIFLGALITAYFNSPEAFERMFPSKDATPPSAPADNPEPEGPSPESAEPGEPEDKKLAQKAKDAAGKALERSGEVAKSLKEGAKSFAEKAGENSEKLAEKGKEIIDATKDASIATAISGKLKLNKQIDASRIKVKVENGSVILTGEVSTRAEERLARDIALDVRFVKDVESQLKINP